MQRVMLYCLSLIAGMALCQLTGLFIVAAIRSLGTNGGVKERDAGTIYRIISVKGKD